MYTGRDDEDADGVDVVGCEMVEVPMYLSIPTLRGRGGEDNKDIDGLSTSRGLHT